MISSKENLIHQTKGNNVLPPYKTSFLELATSFLPNIIKTLEQSCSTMEFWNRVALEWSGAMPNTPLKSSTIIIH
jgi:hypothetical protein